MYEAMETIVSQIFQTYDADLNGVLNRTEARNFVQEIL